MALTDINFYNVEAAVDRGNIGVVSDTTLDIHNLFITVPTITDVRINVSYGQQGSFLGTLNPAGGGGSGYSRGRVVNA